jgi:hypothetical protein
MAMDEQSGLRVTGCPECGAPAEVVPEGRLASTSGPVAIVRIRCAERHWFLMAEDQLPSVPASVGDQASSSDTPTSPGPLATSRRPPGTSGTQASACASSPRQLRASARISERTD